MTGGRRSSVRRAEPSDIDRLVDLCAEHAAFERAEFDPAAGVGDWRIKVYGITLAGRRLAPSFLAAAKQAAFPRLPGIAENRPGLGFLVVHQGQHANWVLLNWWQDECILHHRIFSSPVENPTELVERTADGILACTWELSVHVHERRAWMEEVLTRQPRPDYEAYLARTWSGEV